VVVVEVDAAEIVVVVEVRDAEVSTNCLPDGVCDAWVAPVHPAAIVPTTAIPHNATAARRDLERGRMTVRVRELSAVRCIRCRPLNMSGSS